MASSSSCGAFFGFREVNQMNQQLSSSSTPPPPVAAPPPKRRRNQPGTPSPDAEVVALSPRTLMATNRFICEVCNKGFQREQNLQLHRRGHNLPWKLKQKSTRDARRKVYLCPEPTCVHHHPSRALGDLTGIKKHYSRKHGEKKWQCHKCAKSYAVQSDCKAHTKTCGTKEYRCDCGTLFSRRDSFITHRAFCDALAQESPGQPPSSTTITMGVVEQESSGDMLRRGGSSRAAGQFDHLLPPPHFRPITNPHNYQGDMHGLMMQPQQQYPPSAANLFNLNFLSNNNSADGEESNLFSGNLIRNPMISSSVPCLYSTSVQSHGESYNMPHMSATALLQKAAQLGSTSSSASLLRNLAAAGGGARSDRTDQAVMVPVPGSTFGSVFSESENNNLQDLMNSLAASGSSSLPMFDTETGYIESSNASHKARAGVFGMGGDRLTRDFLGVGHAVTSMSGRGGGGGVDDGTISSAISQSYGGREF